jgi:hypothetical protein
MNIYLLRDSHASLVLHLTEKHRTAGEVELDFDRLARLGSKINELLARKTKGTVEAYAVLRFLCVYYEEDLGIAFESQFEEELHKVVKKSLEGDGKEPHYHDHSKCSDPECSDHNSSS